MKWKKLYIQDLERYPKPPLKNKLFLYIFRKGSQSSSKIYEITNKLIGFLLGCEIPIGTDIGSGIRIIHFNGIIINKNSKIGKNVTIYQQVTIGNNEHRNIGSPTIGDNVYIGSGAKIIGNIKIGDNVKIGANAVIVNDIPDNSTVYVKSTTISKN